MRKKIHSGEMNVHLETLIFIIGQGKKKKKEGWLNKFWGLGQKI